MVYLSPGRSDQANEVAERAGNRSLRFYVEYPSDGLQFEQTIVKFAKRITFLQTFGSPSSPNNQISGDFRKLTTIHMTSANHVSFRLNFQAPSLRTFICDGAFPEADDTLNMGPVQDMILRNMPVIHAPSMLKFLGKCKGLQNLEMRDFAIHPGASLVPDQVNRHMIFLERLNRLVLWGVCTTDARGVFAMVKTPAAGWVIIEDLVPDAQGSTGYPHG